MIGVGVTPGQLTVEVNAGSAAPAGVAVCAHDTIAVVVAAPGVQLTPMSGAFKPSAAGAAIMRFAPPVIAKDDAPGATVQAKAKVAVAVPVVNTVTGTAPAPAVSVADAAIVAVGAKPTTAAALPVKAVVPVTVAVAVEVVQVTEPT